jgi:hypothetical protein
VAHYGTDSDTRAFGGNDTHRQRLDDGGVDGVDDQRRRCLDTRGSAVTYAGRQRRGEVVGNQSTRLRKGVSAVAR